MTPVCFLGAGAPRAMVCSMETRLPPAQNHSLSGKSGASGVPFASAPWQPTQVAPPANPWYTLSPSAMVAGVTPEAPAGTGGGGGRGVGPAGDSPAFGLIPSGGSTGLTDCPPWLTAGADVDSAVDRLPHAAMPRGDSAARGPRP